MTAEQAETTSEFYGLSRAPYQGTWSSGSANDAPIVIDREVRGTLQYVTGNAGDGLTDIFGARIQYGMVVYVGSENKYYKYTKLTDDPPRNTSNSTLPNTTANWSVFSGGDAGPTGPTGNRGIAFYYGTDTNNPLGPMPKPPQVGDIFLNTDTGELYVKNS